MKKIKLTFISIIFALIIIGILIMATVPPVSRDAQTHHLAIPKIWLSEGLLAEIPEIEFSYYPQLIDLLYVLPIKLNYDIAAKYIHFIFALGTMILIICFIRRKLNFYWGILGGLMFLTLPVILKLSVTVYVDLGLLFFFTASLFSGLIWLEDIKKMKWLIISGLTSGLALSIKYNAMLSVTLLALLIGFFFVKTRVNEKQQQFKAIKYLAIFTFCALLVYSPWLIKNYSLTGNPIYPLHQSFFNKSKTHNNIIKKQNKNMSPLVFRRIAFNESLPYTLSIPLRIFLEGKDDDPKYFDGKLNPLLLFLPFLLFLWKKRPWQNQFLIIFTILTVLYTMLAVDMRIRYIITIIPPLIVLSINGLYQLSNYLCIKSPASPLKNIIIPLITIFYFSFNLNYAIDLFNRINPIPYITGKITREDYLNKELSYYSLNKLANKVVPDGKKLLGIYTGNRRYYIDVPLSLESELLYSIAENVNNVVELKKELANQNISHILVRLDLFRKELSYKNDHVKRIILNLFSKNVKLLDKKDVFGFYEIINDAT